MVGAAYIQDLRAQGLKPSLIFIFDLGDIRRDGFYAPETQLDNLSQPEVHIQPNDDIAALDFRFLTGCSVTVITSSKERARDLYRFIKRVKPSSLVISDGSFIHYEEFNE